MLNIIKGRRKIGLLWLLERFIKAIAIAGYQSLVQFTMVFITFRKLRRSIGSCCSTQQIAIDEKNKEKKNEQNFFASNYPQGC